MTPQIVETNTKAQEFRELSAWRTFDPGHVFCVLGVVERDEDGALFSSCPQLPGACSEGETAEVALENLKEAVAGCIQSYKAMGEAIPWDKEACVSDDVILKRWLEVHV